MGIRHRLNVLAAISVLALIGQGANAAEQPSLIGVWRIVRFEPAPWTVVSPALIDQALGFLNARLEFQARRVAGKDPFGCANARYESRAVPTRGLFQGSLTDEKQAKRLGIERNPVPTVGLQCDTGVFDFHFIGSNKAVTALDNVIYVLAREAPVAAGQPASVKAACRPWLDRPGSAKRFPLDSVAVVNDPPTMKEPEAPATLHPDTETIKGNVLIQTWNLADYRDHPIYLRCRYEGTTATRVEPVPDDATECRFSVGWNATRRRVDTAAAPLALECR